MLRLEWGPTGAAAIAPGCAVAVVVDVLSFTTTLTVAADRGVTVWPHPWADATAFAAARDAVCAVGRSVAGPGQVSLSPGSVRAAAGLRRLVLPSPNGSAISARLAREAPVVVGVSLRNRAAAARWLLAHHRDEPVAVVCSGERWPDGTLRPAVEDLWGAGALVAALLDAGWRGADPEARAAAAAFTALDDLPAALRECTSGRELVAAGYPGDVAVAAELDRGGAVPVLRDGAFSSSSG